MNYDVNEEVRLIADGLMLDATLTFVAMVRQRRLAVNPRAAVEAWGHACRDMMETAEHIVEQHSGGPCAHARDVQPLSLIAPSDEPLDERIEVEIQERVRMMTDANAHDESPRVVDAAERARHHAERLRDIFLRVF